MRPLGPSSRICDATRRGCYSRLRRPRPSNDHLRGMLFDLILQSPLYKSRLRTFENLHDEIIINSSQVNQLRSAREAEGRPVLKGRAVANARGTVRYRYHPDEIRRFAKYYGKLGQIAKEHGVSSRAMKRNLAERSIAPIIDPKRLKVEFYRRSEL